MNMSKKYYYEISCLKKTMQFVESIHLKIFLSLFEILFTAVPCLQFGLENFPSVELIAQMKFDIPN